MQHYIQTPYLWAYWSNEVMVNPATKCQVGLYWNLYIIVHNKYLNHFWALSKVYLTFSLFIELDSTVNGFYSQKNQPNLAISWPLIAVCLNEFFYNGTMGKMILPFIKYFTVGHAGFKWRTIKIFTIKEKTPQINVQFDYILTIP